MADKQYEMTAQGPKKKPGWFSWRHQTNAAHLTASEDYRDRRGKAARQRRAAERSAR